MKKLKLKIYKKIFFSRGRGGGVMGFGGVGWVVQKIKKNSNLKLQKKSKKEIIFLPGEGVAGWVVTEKTLKFEKKKNLFGERDGVERRGIGVGWVGVGGVRWVGEKNLFHSSIFVT